MFFSKKGAVNPTSFFQLYKFAEGGDILSLALGAIAAFLAGASLPISLGCVSMGVQPIMEMFLYSRREEQNWKDIVYYSSLAVFGGLFQALMTYIYMAIFTSVGEKISYRLRQAYMKAVLHMDMAWFDTLGAGEITTRITSDIDLVRDGIGERVGILFQDSGIMVMSLVCSFAVNFKLAIRVCWPMLASFLCSFIANIVAQMLTTNALLQFSRAGSLAEETVANIRTTHAFNGFNALSTIYRRLVAKGERKNMLRVCVEGLGIGGMTCAMYLGYALVLWYGYTLNKENELEVFEAVAIILALTLGIYSVSNIPPNLLAITSARSAASKLYEVIETEPTINPAGARGRKLNMVHGNICFKNVSFYYPSRPEVPIFQNFNLTITPGSTVALVGASGSGKSTAIQLLERFYDVCAGAVLLDDVDIREFSIRWYRQQIGLVSQEPVLFSGTVAENVAFGLIGTELEGASKERQMEAITKACIDSNAHSFILALPNGYKTEVGEKGFLLSGGQKQRIAIARAIIRNPKVLLLDEATSALDTKSESVVQDALDRASVGRTTIVIAHRLSTIKDADLILVMDRGMIVESGTHAELMKLTGTYSQLVSIQNIKVTPAVHAPSLAAEACIDNPEPVAIALNDDEEALPLQYEEDALPEAETPVLKSLWFIIQQSMPKMDVLLIGVAGASLLGLVNFMMVSMALKGATHMRDESMDLDDVVWNASAAMILVSVCAGIFQLMSLIGLGLAAQKLASRLRNQLFDFTLQQEIGWFDLDENSVGRLVALLSSSPQSICGFYGETLGAFVFATVNTVSSCAICLYVSYKIALFMMLCYPLLVTTSYISIHLISRFSRKSQKAYNLSTQLACENTSAIRTVASLTREDEVFKHYCASLKAPLLSGLKNAYVSTIVIAMSAAVTPIIVASSFFFTANVLKGYKPGFRMSAGYTYYELVMAVLVLLVMTMSIVGTSRTVNLVYGIRKARNAAKLCFKMSSRQPLIDSSDNSSGRMIGSGFEKYSCPIQGLIEFTNVHFHYPTRPNSMCLKGIDFQVRPGQYVALVGPSGCGKSTTIGLIERFYDISKGSITIDGANISDLHLPSYRDHVALVGQEPALFNISIKDNILLGSRSYGEAPTMDDVIAAARSANIHDFIISLPNGYDTLAGGKGTQMSGGQKQRIAIARALIRNPKVLLLDEATSALDADSEKVVQAALDTAAKGRTTISIAHRLSTIKHADMILVMKDGIIVERGTHDQLLSLNGLYCEMVQQQVLDRSN